MAELKNNYIVFGEEDYLRDAFINDIKSSGLSGAMADLNYDEFTGDKFDADAFNQVINTLPAFSSYRIIHVKNFNKLKEKNLKAVVNYLEDFSSTSILILETSESKISKVSAIYKRVSKEGMVKECKRMRINDLKVWVRNEFKKENKNIDPLAIDKIIDLTGNHLLELKSEVEKVITYGFDKDKITADDVASLGIDIKEDTLFDLADSVAEGNSKKAIKLFDKLSSEFPVLVLGSLSGLFRRLFKVRILMNKKASTDEIKKSINIYFDFIIKKLTLMAGKFTESDFEKIFKMLADCDIKIKSSPIDSKLIMSKLIMDLSLIKNKNRNVFNSSTRASSAKQVNVKRAKLPWQ